MEPQPLKANPLPGPEPVRQIRISHNRSLLMHRRMKTVVYFTLSFVLLTGGCHRANSGQRTRVALPEAADWRTKRDAGIDFVGNGNAPAWSLDIDFDKQIRFQDATGPLLTVPMPKPQRIGSTMGVLLDARLTGSPVPPTKRRLRTTRPERLRVTIEPIVTRDEVQKRDYAYTVRVESAGRRYVGWGAFIKGSDRLNGVWTLESFRGQRLHGGQFADNQPPQLTIDLTSNKLRGSTGFNPLKGDITAEGDHIQLRPDAAKRRACPTSFEADLLAALRKASLFRIGKDRLTLLADGQYVMTWRKVN